MLPTVTASASPVLGVPLALSIPWGAAIIGSIVLCVAAGVALFVVRRQASEHPEEVGFREHLVGGAALVGIPLGLFFWFCGFRVALTDGQTYEQKVGLFSATFDDGNGGTVTVDEPSIVNQSAKPMLLEIVQYGEVDLDGEEDYTFLEPHAATPIRNAAIGLGPKETPPNEISSKGKGDTRRWLRNFTQQEMNQMQAGEQAMLDSLQDQMKELGILEDGKSIEEMMEASEAAAGE